MTVYAGSRLWPGREGAAGSVVESMLNAGVAAIERADRVTRVRTAAEAQAEAMDLISILSETIGLIADHDWSTWPVSEETDEP